ncbi:LysM peptidoglycan-binding domain-containing protein [Hyphococcus formosus]|uniref:LysM peptidoglycan-binding domain-containing protein n=1 Tax=Hyphococcus formosus TaxID=3143534 RepID=UPI00398A559C
MAQFQFMRRGIAVVALMAGFAAAWPAMAGRCGHSYPVDAPTTLSKVARACNVSLAALKEANRGVDPNYVRPGEHLAVPDETDYPGEVPTIVTAVETPDPVYHYEPSPWPDKSAKKTVAHTPDAATGPFYLEASLGRSATPQGSHLSYQQESAARIRNAGLTMNPVNTSPRPTEISVSSFKKVPLSALMECAVLRRQPDGKIAQVREFKPLPEGRDAPMHCTQLTSGTATAIPAPTFHANAAGSQAVLRGYVSFVDSECVTMRTRDGMEWRIAADDRSRSLLGKEATIWADFTAAESCGGMVMDRAIFVERLATR